MIMIIIKVNNEQVRIRRVKEQLSHAHVFIYPEGGFRVGIQPREWEIPCHGERLCSEWGLPMARSEWDHHSYTYSVICKT
jgi:hypothetical protein